jgi:hypothetical protein
MKTSAKANYRHSGKTGQADRRSYHKSAPRQTWSIEEIAAAMLQKIEAGDEFWAGYRAKQLVTRMTEAGLIDEQGLTLRGRAMVEGLHAVAFARAGLEMVAGVYAQAAATLALEIVGRDEPKLVEQRHEDCDCIVACM